MIGGTDDELELVLLALGALAERIDARGYRRPALLDDLRQQLRPLTCLERTNGHAEADLGDGAVVMTPPLLLTKKQAAAALQLGERTVARAVAEGRLRAVHEGRAVRFRQQDLQAYADSLGGDR